MSGRGGIDVPRDLASAQGMPEDLDSGIGGAYTVPSTRRRLFAGLAYAAGTIALTAGILWGGLPPGMSWAGGLLAALTAWHAIGAWRIGVADSDALQAASRSVTFPVGHASAVVGFDGWRSKPVWNVLLFSAEDPPRRRALVRIDAVDGNLVEQYEEAVTSPRENPA